MNTVLVSKSTASLVDPTAADGGTFLLTAEEQVRRQYTRLLAQARPTAVIIETDQHLRFISSLTPICKTFFLHLIHLRISKIAFNTFLHIDESLKHSLPSLIQLIAEPVLCHP